MDRGEIWYPVKQLSLPVQLAEWCQQLTRTVTWNYLIEQKGEVTSHFSLPPWSRTGATSELSHPSDLKWSQTKDSTVGCHFPQPFSSSVLCTALSMEILQQSLKVLSLILARLLVVDKSKNAHGREGRGSIFQQLGQCFLPFPVSGDKSYRRDAADSLQ